VTGRTLEQNIGEYAAARGAVDREVNHDL